MAVDTHPRRIPDPAEARDPRLVRAAAGGDATAFEVLAAARVAPSFRLASAILGDETAAAQVTQDVLVAVWRTLPRLESPETFGAWFRRLLVDECRMQLRRLPPRPDGGGTGFDDEPEVDRALVLDRIEAAFDGFSAEDRAMVALRYLEDAPVTEIAQLLHVPAGTVKLRLHVTHDAFVQALETL